MTEYVIRVERGGGSLNGDIVAIFPTLADARGFLDDPPEYVADLVLSIYNLTPCWEDE